MISTKSGVQLIVSFLKKAGIQEIIISPGSRNGPLTLSLANDSYFRLTSQVDERSAGFVGLGMAKSLQKPVGLLCTSGTAVLNYAPAVAEAYYAHIPLLIMTADRPPEWIDKADGQAIRQYEIFRNYCKASFQFLVEPEESEILRLATLQLEKLYTSLSSLPFGPVHLNIPLREPLYPTTEEQKVVFRSELKKSTSSSFKHNLEYLREKKILIACTNLLPDEALTTALDEVASMNAIPVIAEVTANLRSPNFMYNPDGLFTRLSKIEQEKLSPDYIITLGQSFISKKLKLFIRRSPQTQHLHIQEGGKAPDTFDKLTKHISVSPVSFAGMLKESVIMGEPMFMDVWKERSKRVEREFLDYNHTVPQDTDWALLFRLISLIPSESDIFFGNSTPIRYANIFPLLTDRIHVFANRGTSGIDGCLSTAVGMAYASGRVTIAVLGDLSFLYDSNVIWGQKLPTNLRIVVFNNGGGNIFRVIEGPENSNALPYFETERTVKLEYFCQAFSLSYYFCDSTTDIKEVFDTFLQSTEQRGAILEVKTNATVSAKTLKNYLKD